jgi:hypothetical protein
MKRKTSKTRRGDIVEVKSPGEILETLDADGTIDGLPFMPEMIPFCGRRFQVSKLVVKTCFYASSSGMRKFRADDVVLLDGLRCSGDSHDGCQKACTILWRGVWLRKVSDPKVEPRVDSVDIDRLRRRLKTSVSPKIYFCQASEILNATNPLSRWERFGRSINEVRAGNCSTLEMLRRIGVWLFWKVRRMAFGAYARGNKASTPLESLNLQPGEWVEVKSLGSISETLNKTAHNRGLYFTPAMRHFCGEQRQVERRLEKIIVDGTGEMRQMRNTVYLQDSLCGCEAVAFGGCPRGEFAYWREIWLRRAAAPVCKK